MIRPLFLASRRSKPGEIQQWNYPWRMRQPWVLFYFLFAMFFAACGCKGPAAAAEAKADLDADPFALLPGSAIVIANLDARAIYGQASVGAELTRLTDSLMPLGDDAGFVPSRDVDRMVIAAYPSTGADVTAILVGRFDPEKMARASRAKTGAPIAKSSYAGFATFTVDAVVYAPLTSKTLLGGTAGGVRRALERLQRGKLERAIAPWMIDTLETKEAAIAVAADFASQPIASASLGAIHLPWLKGMRVARLIANFEPPGVNAAATLTYGDAEQAQAASEGMRSVEVWLKLLAPLIGGIKVQNLELATQGADLTCKFALDDQTLRALLAYAPGFLHVLSDPSNSHREPGAQIQ